MFAFVLLSALSLAIGFLLTLAAGIGIERGDDDGGVKAVFTVSVILMVIAVCAAYSAGAVQ